MQQYSVTKYLTFLLAPVLEDEHEWFEKTRTEKNSVVWGIYDITQPDTRTLIGNTSIVGISRGHITNGTSGSMMFRQEYWGKRIASAIHKACTWFAFEQLGLTRIKSAVIRGNVASRKALEKSGYYLVYTERNTAFIDGKLRHQDNFECLNPSDMAWHTWWGDDEPAQQAIEARDKTIEAMDWAKENVNLI